MWTDTTLGQLCKMYQPKTISKKEMVAGGDYVVFGANGIIGTYDKYNHEEPKLLVTCRGATCGAVNISEPFSWINGNAMVIQPDLGKVSLKYMEYLFRGGINLSTAITGTAQPQITRKSLEPIKFSYPPLLEQERIVAKLDAAFAEVESLNKIVSIRKSELAKLKKVLLLTTLSSEKSDLINLGDVCELIYGKGLDKIDRLENDGIPVYGANGIKAYSTKFLSDEPSIIIGRKGSAGELNRVSSAFWALDVTYYTKINKKLIDLDFLYYTLSSMDLPSMAKGVKPGINRNDVYKRFIYLPALEEQKHIVSILDAAYTEIEKVNDSVSKFKNNCDALKRAILKQELQSSKAA